MNWGGLPYDVRVTEPAEQVKNWVCQFFPILIYWNGIDGSADIQATFLVDKSL
nr:MULTISPECIES: hypothetical protein [unclassified Providencia]